ncbi:hypothetical protein Prudu_010152 [Prunus dulcis]|uniref:Uncharacterized protein n=1 Tax=Prunus dulcis TaxID=3755 RepID=A0A4Y1R7X3_PRUDU|nr:hypothetical protein Prudu_010152 [Prunus dulcis]
MTGLYKHSHQWAVEVQDPPPAIPSFRTPSKVEKFGFGQITGETLPKFRQKSKGEFKKNLKQEG